MKKMNISIVILATLLVFSGCKSKKEEQEAPKKVSANTVVIEPVRAIEAESIPGRFEAKDTAVLASKVMGFVREIRVKEGDFVKKGTLIVAIDDREIQSNIKSLEDLERSVSSEKEALRARYDYAYSNYIRFKNLYEENAVTREEFERIQSEYLATKKQLEAIESRIKSIRSQKESVTSLKAYTRIVAPFDGFVIAKHIDVGSFVTPGVPIITMVSAGSKIEFSANIPERLFPVVKKLEKIPIYVDALNKVVEGKVKAVAPAINPETSTFLTKIIVDSSEIKHGMFGKLILPKQEAEKILIPEKYIVKRGNISAVYKVDKDKIVHFQVVRTGDYYVKTDIGILPEKAINAPQDRERLVEITGGLNPGDVIVTDIDKVREGDSLE